MKVTNGVNQGGILSPILFIVYMDVILLKLKESRMRCHIGSTFCGTLGYTVDVSLLCPTLSSLKVMLSIADEFGKQFNVTFNALKYQLLVYSDTDNQIEGLEHNEFL